MLFGTTEYSLAKLLGLSGTLMPALRQNSMMPTGFSQAIEPIIIGDALDAFKIYAGKFEFAGQSISSTPHRVFKLRQTHTDWHDGLMRLNWLKHFNASKRSLHDQHAMRLLNYWSQAKKSVFTIAQRADIICTLATHGYQIAQRCELQLQKDLLRIVSIELKALISSKSHSPEDSVIKALTFFYSLISFQNLGHLRKAAQDLFDRNVDKLILPDGGHVSRDICKLISFLSLALPLQRYQNLGLPDTYSAAVRRSFAHLKLLQGHDGKLSVISGLGHHAIELSGLFEYYGQEISRPSLAPDSGFARLDQGKASLIADTHTALGIDFFFGGERLFHTAQEQSHQNFPAQLRSAPQGQALIMASSQLKRTCFLSADGSDLRVEDEVAHQEKSQMVVHVPTSVKLSTLMEGKIVIFVTPDKSVWHLRQRGGSMQIQQAAFHNDVVIIHDPTLSNGRLNWSLKKQSSPVKTARKKQAPTAELLI